MATDQAGERAEKEPIYAEEGAGPLLKRDYSATIDGTDRTPEQVAEMVRARFCEFAPPETAAFCHAEGGSRPLEVGDELEIKISLVGTCRVRVVHVDAHRLTLRTLRGHPEAGRITFGAGRDGQGRTTFRIGSRTRAGGVLHYLGFLVLGKQMQSRTWIKFVGNVAEACGGSVLDAVHVRTSRCEEEPADREDGPDDPVFACEGVG